MTEDKGMTDGSAQMMPNIGEIEIVAIGKGSKGRIRGISR